MYPESLFSPVLFPHTLFPESLAPGTVIVPSSGTLLPQLPEGRIAKVFNAVRETLKDDPTLLSANLKITTYRDGYDDSAKVKNAPDEDELPYVRLMIDGSKMGWENNHQHQIGLALKFVMYVKGSYEDDLTNLAEAICQALYPQEPTRRDLVQNRFASIEGCRGGHFSDGMDGVEQVGYSQHGLAGTMRLQIMIALNT